MVNTKILTNEFEYHKPNNLAEIFKLITEYGTSAKLIAGGTDIIPGLKYERFSTKHLINIADVQELKYIKEDQGLRIGAATKLNEIKKFCAGKIQYNGFYDAVSSIAKIQILNMGTLGGNLCTASPAADSAPALLTFEAKVALSNGKTQRVIELIDFFTGVQQTVKESDEVMTEIIIPPVSNQVGSAFRRMVRVAADISKLSCAVLVNRQGDSCQSARVAMGAIAATPVRLISIEGMLENQKIDESVLNEIGNAISEAIQPITDIRSNEMYRKQVAGVLFKDVFQIAWQQAGVQ